MAGGHMVDPRILAGHDPEKFDRGVEQKVKFQLVGQIVADRETLPIKNVVKLVALMIQEYREANDTATIRQVLRNQGKIQGLEELRDNITKDFPI